MRQLSVLAAFSMAALLPGFATPQREAIQVGDEARYTFREPVFNSMGIKSLEELRGKPVLLEFWGTR